jgi:predicted TIM-barrel fold metal-dependent hydrolase
MPTIIVNWLEGRTEDTKKAVAKGITEVINKEAGAPPRTSPSCSTICPKPTLPKRASCSATSNITAQPALKAFDRQKGRLRQNTPNKENVMIRIIDSHNHLGGCRIFLGNFTEEALLDTMEKAGVYGAVLMPFPGAEDIPATHDRIAALAAKYPGRFWGISSVNPHDVTDGFEKESTRAVKELGFKALKLHTVGHAVNPTSPMPCVCLSWLAP